MKIAYLLNWELSSNDGVTKKVFAQTHEWQHLGHQVTVFCISHNSVSSFGKVPLQTVQKEKATNIVREFSAVYKAYSQIFIFIKNFQPDVLYFRFDVYQPALRKILKAFPSVIEMNTNDLEEFRFLATQNTKGKVRYLYHKLVRNRYLKSVKAFCCVTNEIAALTTILKYNKITFVVPNSLTSNEFTCSYHSYNSQRNIPRLVFIGSPQQAWHGLDKILELAKRTEGKLNFDIIGTDGSEFNHYPTNVTFHGYLQKKEYERIICNGDIGVCTLAMHRNNMQEGSPLKTREYLAYGLPVILGYTDTAFISSNVPEWLLQLPNNEQNVLNNIQFIVDFSYKYLGVKLTKSETEKFIDAAFFEKERIRHMQMLVKQG